MVLGLVVIVVNAAVVKVIGGWRWEGLKICKDQRTLFGRFLWGLRYLSVLGSAPGDLLGLYVPGRRGIEAAEELVKTE